MPEAGSLAHRVVAAGLALAAAAAPGLGPAAEAPGTAVFQGFGASTRGGEGRPRYHVTTLADAGPGSLREALSVGGRHVVFDVAGDIHLERPLYVRGAFLTVDGLTAPAPGITLRGGWGLVLRGDGTRRRPGGAHDVIVRGLRVRAAAATRSTDCIQVGAGAYNIVIDHVSVHGCADGALDITDGAHDVTVSWSILGEPVSGKTMLITARAHRVTLHHNVLVGGKSRKPSVAGPEGAPGGEATLDMRNNVVWDWGPGYGTLVRYGARANVVANFYGNPRGEPRDRRQALIICKGDPAREGDGFDLCGRGDPARAARGHARGNVSADEVDVDAAGNAGDPFPAPPVDTVDACAAARRVLAEAGVRPFDSVDRELLSSISLARCADLHLPAQRSTSRGTSGS
jgi:hypothetical protein